MSAIPPSNASPLSAETEALRHLVVEQQALIDSLRREKDEVARLLTEQIEKFVADHMWFPEYRPYVPA